MTRLTLCLGCAIFMLIGCRQPQGPPTGDAAIVRELVSAMADASDNSEGFLKFFAKDATVPPEEERLRYSRLYFDPDGDPIIKDTVATIKVKARKDDEPPKGPVEWTFVKEGDRWKLKSAPLP